ncbi:undecaprenyldiphospho-muramoylpentapeptide beta-N-acetylglucosaminyltransferase [Reinekea marina]|uniref:UDP-N-acetylglucosamine--N-acetylmuramyl-(pentapeptide) pyrophosphoryl-undecaprenol N-acetylglucosamine transferase n=1 Tax=Reinekea marina TaxID=1310421 RepID=A0ABV7WPR2_9GAMM|nr:undecaprenyldiphospho-muramoylpentapeptide beta-N-acetylglucosaminyltransferase [Reinekea marina]MDN3650526.1 undecaprenyldiphospho-muramoylpentapeptide beta-N-acetylglucosaminyltransferase [Reinekea marina]
MKVMIMAGGTGGHIFPANAVADALKERGMDVHWLGSIRGMEQSIVEKLGYPFHGLPVSAWHGGKLRKLMTPINLLRSLWVCYGLFRKQKPDVVVGFGGYPSAPGGLMASMLNIPLVLHEQNGTPGLTNKKLAHRASMVLQAFPNTFAGQYPVVGNPVRKALASMTKPSLRKQSPSGALNVLVLGGSLGAQAINELMPKAAALLKEPVNVWHQTGRGKKASVQDQYTSGNAKVTEFIDDMAEAYRWADVVVARSGASTVSEIAAVGLPALFVPYPWHGDKQQYRNAEWLCNENCAQWIEQSELTPKVLAEKITDWQRNREGLIAQADKAWHLGIRDSAEIMVEYIVKATQGKQA